MARVMTWIENQPRLARWVGPWKQIAYSFQLILERRLWLFLVIDGILVLQGTLDSLIGGGELDEIFNGSVFMPTTLLCLPALSGVVALERRVGSLDLALSAPSTERYFLRRVVPICTLFFLQGALFLILSYLENHGFNQIFGPHSPVFGLVRVLIQCALFHLFIGTVVLFWATRLRTVGGVWGAALITVMIFRSWLLTNPLLKGAISSNELLWGIPRPLLSWMWAMAVIAVATLILYLYARERLWRPETMLD